MRLLIKVGGTLLDTPETRLRLAREIAEAAISHQVVVVHGGGKQMTRFLAERGVESRFVNGLRVTTPDIMDAVLKVFAGSVNTGLVASLRCAGARPVGLTGLDAGLVDAEILDPVLGQVGRPARADATLLEVLAGASFLPVVACIAGDAQGAIYNVNADQMAVACAVAFRADRLLFLTDVEGVRTADGRTASCLTISEAHALVENGTATGGMQAKLEASTDAVNRGVGEVCIASGSTAGVVRQLLGSPAIGTRLIPSR